MVNLLAAAALAAAIPATTPAPPAEPAMFVVRDADTTVYIFGTFHALDGDPQWFDRGSGTPSSNRTSWCSKPCSRKGPARRHRQAGLPVRAAFGHSVGFLPGDDHAWRSTPASRRA